LSTDLHLVLLRETSPADAVLAGDGHAAADVFDVQSGQLIANAFNMGRP
jgi:hypothetical protein